ncbi:MAG: hypothetical protein ACD_10C00715G0001 [uncultured bacterium]|nr:MAG: hypothetical protein ACD_10C00715G0001 [uncultured bacterium]
MARAGNVFFTEQRASPQIVGGGVAGLFFLQAINCLQGFIGLIGAQIGCYQSQVSRDALVGCRDLFQLIEPAGNIALRHMGEGQRSLLGSVIGGEFSRLGEVFNCLVSVAILQKSLAGNTQESGVIFDAT